jgi:hypothetical protein
VQPLFNARFDDGSSGGGREQPGLGTKVVHEADDVEFLSLRDGSPDNVDVGPFGAGTGGAVLAVDSSSKVFEVVELAGAEAKLFLNLGGRVSQPDWRCAHGDFKAGSAGHHGRVRKGCR